MTEEAPGQAFGPEWSWTLISGLFTLLLGLVAFLLPTVEWIAKGGFVGWLLFLAGLSELILGWRRGLDAVGKAAVGSGLITALAGLFFIANPASDYLHVANVVMTWLLIRGAWVFAMGMWVHASRTGYFLVVTGAADMLLGVALIIGLQVSALVVHLFGPTPEIVTQFAFILAISFVIAGLAQVAIALVERRKAMGQEEDG